MFWDMGRAPSEIERYSRQVLLPEWGLEGQSRLGSARILIVGAGGLGSPAAMYLAAAGVGTLGLVDFDVVDLSNLQRQILYSSRDEGRSKLSAAVDRLRDLNPHVSLERHDRPFDAETGLALVQGYDVIIDGSDNFATRYLVNDACVIARRPNVYGSVFRFEGQASVFATAGGPCYRCLHPAPPPDGLIPSCAEAGVLGVLPGLIGIVQATEAMKLVTGVGEPLVGRLLLYDALRMKSREIALPRDPECPVCGDRPTIRELVSIDRACEPAAASSNLTVEEFAGWRAHQVPHLVVDVREPSEHAIAHIDDAVLIPLRELAGRIETLPRDRPIVVHCKSGGRSARAVALLRGRGLDARNLTGGLLAWQARRTSNF
jgi:sulfur-carrier protein adenylyltransferase/sulfurtransferase